MEKKLLVKRVGHMDKPRQVLVINDEGYVTRIEEIEDYEGKTDEELAKEYNLLLTNI